jgi:hypothetical protein
LLYDSYSTFDSPKEFQSEFSSSPPSSSSMSSHDSRHILASPLVEQEERKGARRAFPISPVPSAAATEGVPESSGKVAFGFRKYASVIFIFIFILYWFLSLGLIMCFF